MAVAFERVAPVLPVRNVARALERYRQLGFVGSAYREPGVSSEDDPIYGFISWGSVELHLSRFEELDPKTTTSVCYLYVDDANALHAAWVAAGVEGRLRTRPTVCANSAMRTRTATFLRVGSPLKKAHD